MTTPKKTEVLYRKLYPQTCQAVGEARRAVVGFARTCGFVDQALDDIEIAVGEALANAFEHGWADRGSFEVTVCCEPDALTIEVADNGGGFDHTNSGHHIRPSSEALRGFGTYIMRELMDEVEYSQRGTRLRLLKRFRPVAVAEWPAVHYGK